MYFSPLSVTDDKHWDRNHPFSSSYSAGRVMVLFKVAGYFLYYILIARCWLLFIPYPITGLFDERWTFCGCVAVIGLGDLVTWRHFVRASRGQLSVLLF